MNYNSNDSNSKYNNENTNNSKNNHDDDENNVIKHLSCSSRDEWSWFSHDKLLLATCAGISKTKKRVGCL